MGEKYGDIKELFDKNDKRVIIDNCQKQETLKNVKRNLKTKNQPALMTGSYWQIMKYQICYMDKTILIVHLTVCMGVVFLGTGQQWGQISMIISGALGALSLLEVGNLFFSRMAELGDSCYFNVRQLTAFQMVYSGVISLVALLAATLFSSLKYQLDIMKTSLYILVPFVFTECICMTVMITGIGRRNLLPLIAVGIFSALFWGVLSLIPNLYEASALALWGVALIVGIGILTIQSRRFFSALDKGEIVCAD
ncbi:MAG: hypothetical protein K2G51_12780 [Lachnospiraceae bacterium]|nr:hypothetical protein [Lachnospiraceae bacterium]MDE7274251.1 hypothetical protein [Lachnospiraceae bacterium]